MMNLEKRKENETVEGGLVGKVRRKPLRKKSGVQR